MIKNQAFRLLFVLLVFQTMLYAQSEGMVSINGSRYLPLYGRDSTVVAVKDFEMDVYPVTNSQYVDFVNKYPKWQKSKVIRVVGIYRYTEEILQ